MFRIENMGLNMKLLLCAVLLLRAAIPAGFMPAAAGSGLLFDLCPERVPAQLMDLLSGAHHHGHGAMDKGEGGHDEHRCPFGLMLLHAAAVDDHWSPDATTVSHDLTDVKIYSYSSSYRTPYLSRGPPA